ncbi:MAG: CHAT domain-containing tetratricopeptide repeat protein [Bacteroidota bacterium]
MRTTLSLCLVAFLNLPIFAQFSIPTQWASQYRLAQKKSAHEDNEAALELLRELLDQVETGSKFHQLLAADTTFFRASIDYRARKMTLAEQGYVASLQERERILGKVDSSVGVSCSRLGMLYRRTGELERAESFMQRALAIHSEVLGSQHVMRAYALNNLGNLYKSMGRADKAVEHYQQALSIYQYIEHDSLRMTGSGQTYLNYAIVLHRMGEYGEAEAKVQQGLDGFRSVYGNIHQELGQFWFEMARLAIDQGDFGLSLIYADSAAMAWEGKNIPEYQFIKIIRGIAYAEKGDYPQAEAYQLLALEEMKNRDRINPLVVAGIYGNLATVALLQDQGAKAEQYLQKSIALQEDILDPEDGEIKKNYYLLAQILEKQGRYSEALRELERALLRQAGKSPTDFSENGPRLLLMGSIAAEQDNFQQADDYFAQARLCYENEGLTRNADYAKVYEKMAEAFVQQNAFEEAKVALQNGRKALGYEFDVERSSTLPPLLSPYTRGPLLENLQQTAATYQAEYQHKAPSNANPQYAWHSLELAVDLLDSMRLSFRSHGAKALLHDKYFPIYDAAIQLAWQNYQEAQDPNWLEEAFRLSERNKSMLLFEALRDHQAQRFAGIPDSVLQRERRLSLDLALAEKKLFEIDQEKKQALIEARKEMLDLRDQYDQFIASLETRFPAYYQLKYSAPSVSLAQIQQQLSEKEEAWLSYFIGEDFAYVFVIQNDELNWERIESTLDISNGIQALREALQQSSTQAEQISQLSYALFEQLLAPVSPLPERLVIIPDGILGYLPFDLLLTEKPKEGQGFKDLPYLLRDRQLSYAYSANLHYIESKKLTNPRLRTRLAAYAPSFPSLDQNTFAESRDQLAPLAHNQSEIRSLKQYFPARMFLSEQASEASFKQNAGTYDIIHIASHALVNDQNPLYSHIRFSQEADSIEDGVLELAELFNLRLNAELVVLSACETGLGKLQRGEGILSLARGMSYAGANSVLTSLWQVNDASTADLMQRFYAHLDQGMSKDAALRNAKLDYLRESDQLGSHPYYWASFVPIGDMRPLDTNNWIIPLLIGLVLFAGFAVYWRMRKAPR